MLGIEAKLATDTEVTFLLCVFSALILAMLRRTSGQEATG
jgi:hypothetical protein